MIVGQETMPESPRSKWAFLNGLIELLAPGQVIRLAIPSVKHRKPIDTHWRTLCLRKKVVYHTRLIRNGENALALYLWYNGLNDSRISRLMREEE